MQLLRRRTLGLLIALAAAVLGVGLGVSRYAAAQRARATKSLVRAIEKDESATRIAGLLAAGADPNARLPDGNSLLRRAMQPRDPSVSELSLHAGKTPLMLTHNVESARALVAAGASVHARDSAGATALHHAAGKNAASLVGYLLRCGANPHQRDRHGETPLSIALTSLYAAVGPTTGRKLTSAEESEVRQDVAFYAEAGVPAAKIVLFLRRAGARE
ncbi:MAG: ankyrin repeat domain-containing protein [Armatimonadota bacterium]